jgi:hypothetical protein
MPDDRRLIEDYLPIVVISAEASREKSVRKGHISTLHQWWARRPLVACRAAVYGALVPASRFVPNGASDAKKKSLGRANAAKFVERLCKYPGDPKVAAMSPRPEGSRSLARSMIIDEDEVEFRLAALAAYAGWFYRGLDRGDLITRLYLGASLTGIDHKSFGKLPSSQVTNFAMPSHGPPDPLNVPDTPLRISRADLADPKVIARKLTSHMARAFRNARAYYTP